MEYQIDEETGLPKNTPIEYFLNGESLGKTLVSEKSFSGIRIKEANAIGIDFYDEFILTKSDGTVTSSKEVKMLYDGILDTYSDFRRPDKAIDTEA